MHTDNEAERTLTQLDYVRLARLCDSNSESDLRDVLDAVGTVRSDEIAGDIVTMNSRVALLDAESGESLQLSLSYPALADVSKGLVSVLSPIGAALLGRKVGSVASWTVPGGRVRAATVTAILYQPEALGDFSS
jgi:regulator of nucleoside diphosphate kinase